LAFGSEIVIAPATLTETNKRHAIKIAFINHSPQNKPFYIYFDLLYARKNTLLKHTKKEHRIPCPTKARQSPQGTRKRCPRGGTDSCDSLKNKTGDFGRNATSPVDFQYLIVKQDTDSLISCHYFSYYKTLVHFVNR
jgi:hypothetical protein